MWQCANRISFSSRVPMPFFLHASHTHIHMYRPTPTSTHAQPPTQCTHSSRVTTRLVVCKCAKGFKLQKKKKIKRKWSKDKSKKIVAISTCHNTNWSALHYNSLHKQYDFCLASERAATIFNNDIRSGQQFSPTRNQPTQGSPFRRANIASCICHLPYKCPKVSASDSDTVSDCTNFQLQLQAVELGSVWVWGLLWDFVSLHRIFCVCLA